MGKWLQHLDEIDTSNFTVVNCSPALEWPGLHTWLRLNTIDDFVIPRADRILFKNEQDAVLFTLKYGQP